MSISDFSALPVRPRHLSHREAAELAFQATQDDADNQILLMMGFKVAKKIEFKILIAPDGRLLLESLKKTLT